MDETFNFSSFTISDIYEKEDQRYCSIFFKLDEIKYVLELSKEDHKGDGVFEIISVDHDDDICPHCGAYATMVIRCTFYLKTAWHYLKPFCQCRKIA